LGERSLLPALALLHRIGGRKKRKRRGRHLFLGVSRGKRRGTPYNPEGRRCASLAGRKTPRKKGAMANCLQKKGRILGLPLGQKKGLQREEKAGFSTTTT